MGSLGRRERFAGSQRQGTLGLLRDIALFPLQLLVNFGVFLVTGWASSRSVWAFVLGLPAMLAIFFTVIAALVHTYFYQRLTGRYVLNGTTLLKEADYPTAILYLQKACLMRFPHGTAGIPPDEQDLGFFVYLGDAIFHQDGLEQAVNQIQVVSPPDHAGFLDGHMWIVKHYFSLPGGPSPEQMDVIGRHLAVAYQKYPDDFWVNYLYATYYTVKKEVEKSLAFWSQAVKDNPAFLPDYLKALQTLGRTTEFDETLRNGTVVLHDRATADADNPDAVYLWNALIQSEILDKNFRQAIFYVRQAESLAGDNDVIVKLRAISSRTFVQWFDHEFDRNDETKFKNGIRMITSALLEYPPNNEAVERALAIITDPPLDDEHYHWLVDSVGNDSNATVIQILLGLHALLTDHDKGIETARSYWSIAEAQNRMLIPSIISNFATIMAMNDETKIDTAVQMFDLAYSNSPNNKLYPMNKGRMFVVVKHWADARKQFEELLPGSKNKLELLNLLVKCCEELGDQAAADEYKQQISKL